MYNRFGNLEKTIKINSLVGEIRAHKFGQLIRYLGLLTKAPEYK